MAGLHKITQNVNHRAPPSWMPEISTDVVKYCKNDFRQFKKKKVSSTSTDDLQHQKLKLYLHFTKKSLKVIRINFVEIPWLVSLLKTEFSHSQMHIPSLPETICNSLETELHLHFTEKGLAVITSFLGTHFDSNLWSKWINSALSELIFPSTSFPTKRWFLRL